MKDSFEVVVRKKVPYFTDFLSKTILICFLFLWLVDFLFLPVAHTSDEIQTTWYILVIPRFIKVALYYTSITMLIALPLYFWVRLYKNAVLTFLPEAISIIGRSLSYTLNVDRIKRIYYMDAKNYQGIPKGKPTFYFQYKRVRQIREFMIRVRLNDYSQLDEFMEKLTAYTNMEIKFYDLDVSPDSEEEI